MIGTRFLDTVPTAGAYAYSVERLAQFGASDPSDTVVVTAVHHREATPQDTITGIGCEVARVQGGELLPCTQYGLSPGDLTLYVERAGDFHFDGVRADVFLPDANDPQIPHLPKVVGPTLGAPSEDTEGCIGYSTQGQTGTAGEFVVCER